MIGEGVGWDLDLSLGYGLEHGLTGIGIRFRIWTRIGIALFVSMLFGIWGWAGDYDIGLR